MKTKFMLFLGSGVSLTTLLLLLITVPLMFSGCEVTQTSTDNSHDRLYYVDKAKNAIDKYRMTDHNEFYGFTLGEDFEGRNSFPFSQDEETGGRIYSLKDPKGVFGTLGICTDESGIILKIALIKRFNYYDEGMDFFRTIGDKLNATYPAKYNKVFEDMAFIEVYVAKDDNDWLEKYSEYLKGKEQRTYFYDTFPYILHPLLEKIKCGIVKTEDGKAVFLLEYTGKEYVRLKEVQKKKLKEKLGEL